MRKTLVLTLAIGMMAASLPADAGGGHGHGHTRARIGVYIGAPLLVAPLWAAPRPYVHYYPSYSYYHAPPVVLRERVVVREPLVFYDERGNPVPPAQVQAEVQQPQPGAAAPAWFFCADSQTYYPYAQTCATPWQRVMPHPPPQ